MGYYTSSKPCLSNTKAAYNPYLETFSKDVGRGHEVSILCGGSLKRGFKKYELEGRSILELPYLPGRKFPFFKKISEEVFFNWAAARWLQTNQNSFDLVHLQGRSGLGIYGFNSRISLPIFHTFHGLISLERKMNALNEKLSIEDKFHARIFSSWEKSPWKNRTESLQSVKK
ncbi:MAG: glycosyltransferase family 4 protein [Saprospiraceae bacterium]